MDLKEVISESILKLQENYTLVANIKTAIGGNQNLDDYFGLILTFAKQLEEIDTLFEVRALHRDTLNDLYDKTISRVFEPTINYLGREINSNLVKFIALQGYFSSTWAIYDTIALIVGRASFTNDIAAKQNAFPRLPENIILLHKHMGFRMHGFMYNLYAYPILLSYCLRNHLVHESCFKSNDIFKTDNMAIMDAFFLNEAFYDKFDDKYSKSSLSKTHSRRDDSDWDENNIIKIIEYTEMEIDEANSILLTWTINGILEQLKLFALR